MHTKFKKWHTKALDDCHWKWIASAEVDSNTPAGKRKFLNWMTETFGESSNRWSIRWSMLGVDIRFHEPKDYFRFTMFHSIDPEKE